MLLFELLEAVDVFDDDGRPPDGAFQAPDFVLGIAIRPLLIAQIDPAQHQVAGANRDGQVGRHGVHGSQTKCSLFVSGQKPGDVLLKVTAQIQALAEAFREGFLGNGPHQRCLGLAFFQGQFVEAFILVVQVQAHLGRARNAASGQ